MASQVPIMLIPSSMLLQILAACPAPWSPARIVMRLIGSSAASTRAKSPSSQPTMKASVPASAAAVPPDTGASAKA